MEVYNDPAAAINASTLCPGRRIYASGNAATPQTLLKQIAMDETIDHVELMGVLFLGDVHQLPPIIRSAPVEKESVVHSVEHQRDDKNDKDPRHGNYCDLPPVNIASGHYCPRTENQRAWPVPAPGRPPPVLLPLPR